MQRQRLALFAGAAMIAAVSCVPAHAEDPQLQPPSPPPAGRGHLTSILIGAVAGAYLWPLVFPTVAEAVVTAGAPAATAGGSAIGGAVETVAALPGAAAASLGLPMPAVPSVGVYEYVSAWRVGGWYPTVMGAVHGGYFGYLVSR